ncbi:MAG: hypothetical protein ABIO70_19890, partial [Pseudomonadota bacterium]
GAPGGDPVAAPPEQRPFADYEGPTVALSGRASAPAGGIIDLDLWQPDPAADGARVHLGKLAVEPGVFSLEVPASFGALQIEAFQDLTGDGPSVDDPFGRLALLVEDAPLAGLALALEEGAMAAVLGAGGGPDATGAEHTDAAPGAPGGDPASAPPEDLPFADHEGPTVALSGQARSSLPGTIYLDLWRADPKAPGSRTHLGKVAFQPGVFSVEVPASFGPLQLEAFQDLTGDGPSLDDPFGRIDVEVGASPLAGLKLALEVGAMGRVAERGGAPGGAEAEHKEAPPGAPGGDATAGIPEAAPGAPGGEQHPHVEAPPGAPGGDPGATPGGTVEAPDPFAAVDGPRVKLSGTIVYQGAHALLDMDIFQIEPNVQGGRAFVGKEKLAAGAFTIRLPVSLGKVDLEVFLDRDGDGPTPGDPFATCAQNPISLTGGDVRGLVIDVAQTAPGPAPKPTE